MDVAIGEQSKNRLIVLIPGCLARDAALAHKVGWIALREKREVHYLTLLDDAEQPAPVTPEMLSSQGFPAAHTLKTSTSGWLRALQAVYRPGDRIACPEELAVRTGLLRVQPVAEFLRDRMHFQVLPLPGFYHPEQLQLARWARRLVAWLGFLLILAGFTWLEIQINPQAQGLAGKLLLCLVLIVEVGAIWGWNNLNNG
jgi:hypothetical protein